MRNSCAGEGLSFHAKYGRGRVAFPAQLSFLGVEAISALPCQAMNTLPLHPLFLVAGAIEFLPIMANPRVPRRLSIKRLGGQSNVATATWTLPSDRFLNHGDGAKRRMQQPALICPVAN